MSTAAGTTGQPPADAPEGATTDQARLLRILLIALGALAALALLYFVVLRPLLGGDDVAGGPAGPGPLPTQTTPPFPTPSPTAGETPVPQTFDVFTARDPFQQLVVVSTDAPADGSGGTPPPGGTGGTPAPGSTSTPAPGTTSTPAPGTTPAPGSTSTPAPGTTPVPGSTSTPAPGTSPGPGGTGPGGTGPGGSGAQVGSTRIELVDVFADEQGRPTVTVTVNGAGYEVREGQTFADNLRLLDISGTCATFLFGDSRFTICEGGSIRK